MEIFESLLRHGEKERASFHMPGHKNGAAFFGTRFENSLLALDVTELADTDALCHPREAIFRSQSYAAKLYGAANAFYLVNGSSCGILSMIYAYFREGDCVLVDRGAHRSVHNAFALSGAHPIYLAPQMEEKREIPCGITAEQVRAALEKYPKIRGIIITSPNYYGCVSEVEEIARAAHEKGISLLVDEAHGAHFPFDKRFPTNAIRLGADAAVVSLHKSLPCPNQTALLLLREEKKAKEVAEAVNIFQTTSPSYVLLSYMEAALEFAEAHGREKTDWLLEQTEAFANYRMPDPFKLLLSFEEYGLGGLEAEKVLREKYGIYAELAEEKNVLLMCSWGNRAEDFKLLAQAIAEICGRGKRISTLAKTSAFPTQKRLFSEGAVALSPRELRTHARKQILLSEAAGKICAASVTLFPPCVPILLPGEMITKEQTELLSALRQSGRTVDGVSDGKIYVLEE